MQPPSHFAQPDDTHLPVAQRRAARPPGAVLAVPVLDNGALALRVSSIAVRRDDKTVFDSYAAFCEAECGRRLRHWDVFTLLLEEAMANPSGRFAAWSRWRSGLAASSAPVSRGDSSRRGDPRSSLSLSRVR